MAKKFKYVIAGGGLAGASAISGIRQVDPKNEILLVSAEKDLPYDRPPLSKKLWLGKTTVEKIFLNPENFYSQNNVEILSETRVETIDSKGKTITTGRGDSFAFDKLLLATGGEPRRLTIPGADNARIFYYRTLPDYLRLREEAKPGKSALIIGGGFIGSEIAAALAANKIEVYMIFPEKYLTQNVFPEDLGTSIMADYAQRGVRIITEDIPVEIARKGTSFITRTRKGMEIPSEIVVAGIGISPSVEIAKRAGLKTDNGIVVDSRLATSHPDIFAAGDNANFESGALGKRIRVEHWDNAKSQGLLGGRNMAGAEEPADYVPYFFSDLFDFGYESAGELDSAFETYAVWKERFRTGIIYYMSGGIVRGAMLCNVWDRVEDARSIVRSKRPYSKAELDSAIAF